jgi:GT2 family glycosyltransferase/SAM-dependent methyltransferase/glycosyltransferase involved in cell wall biosynthesis
MNGHDAKGVPDSHSEAETRRGRHGRSEHTSRSSAGEPDRLIDWTGERCVPWADDLQVIYEHYHRYLFAAPLVADRRVLDLASGEGYGAALLARRAREVVGIDIDQPSVEHSQRTYPLDNLLFDQGDMLDLSRFPDGAFDVVICFEAVEHVADQERLLSEIARVLSPAGLLVLSTPDREVHPGKSHHHNPFHVRELSRAELSGLLEVHFPQVRLWGQNVAVGSVILPLDSSSGPGEVTTLSLEEGQTRWAAGTEVTPTYFVAVASRGALPDLPSYSTLVDMGLELVRRSMRERDEARSDLTRVTADRDDAARRLDEERSARLAAVADGEEMAKVHEEDLQSLRVLRRSHERGRLRQGALSEALIRAREELRRVGSAPAELAALKGSAFYRGALSYRRAVGRVAPDGSLRRHLYRDLLRIVMPGPKVAVGAPRAVRLSLTLPTSSDPETTILIPAHNQWALTVDCLRSIAEDIAATPYEVVVVDDASTDETSEVLAQVGGVKVVRLKHNRGFVGAVNAGLTVSRGRYIVLLNNDTVVQPGWLDALVETAAASGDIGLVGAKLVYSDGRLQEAGAIIKPDGSAWNYGRYQEAADPAFNFPREVDYCSGACLLIRRELLDAVGGLDTRFAPGYYDDADLAFAARERGYRVLYQPKATVIHLEGASHGTDVFAGTKRYQVINQEKFCAKWAEALTLQSTPEPFEPRVASWRSAAGRALLIDHQIPTPDQDSGSRRMFEVASLLVDLGFAVTFMPHNGADSPAHSQALRDRGIEVLPGPHRLPEFLAQVHSNLRLAMLSRPSPAWRYLPLLREMSPDTKVVFDTVDLHFLRLRRQAECEGSPALRREAERHQKMELALARNVDETFVVSPVERDLLLREDPSLSVHVIPNIHAPHHLGRPFARRQGLLFVGSFPHPPNRDAAHWLVEEILPRVHQELPDVMTYIVGSQPTEDIKALAGDGVRVLGWVEDLTELYETARLFVAPLRYGAGMKGKVGESLAYGLPVVTSPIGAEGMGLQEGQDLLVAESASEFAAEVVRAYSDEALWKRLAARGQLTITRRYSPDAVRPLLAEVLKSMGVLSRVSGQAPQG